VILTSTPVEIKACKSRMMRKVPRLPVDQCCDIPQGSPYDLQRPVHVVRVTDAVARLWSNEDCNVVV
jgi:hypothetical protein